MDRRTFLKTAGAGVAFAAASCATVPQKAARASKPNFIIILTDDQGYADVGCFGAKYIKTPCLDRMAGQGIRFTDFHVAAPVCSPSRAALMTGCYPQHVGMGTAPFSQDPNDKRANGVIMPSSRCGLNPDEITIPKMLKGLGYATGCVGKWHLGHLPPFLPTRNGFDTYFGIPYSNDMAPSLLMRNEATKIEQPVVQDTLTERYVAESIRFISEHKDQPFFLYLAHNMPHIPLHASERFRHRSAGGLYGDVIECIDWGVGKSPRRWPNSASTRTRSSFLPRTTAPGIATAKTVVLRRRSGHRKAPPTKAACACRASCAGPEASPAGQCCAELATTMDLLPTVAQLAGGAPPTDRIIDGKDIRPLLSGQRGAKSPYDAFYYYFGNNLQAVRSGFWKLRLATTLQDEDCYRKYPVPDAPIPEALYNLDTDPGEQKSVFKDHP